MSIANPHLQGDDPGLKLKRLAAMASLSVAGVLIATKFTAYMMTDSVSLLSSLMDSTFDAVASLVTLLGIIHAATPADAEHRFGHGKAEAFAALGQAIFIFASSAFLFFESVHRFVQPQKVSDVPVGVAVMALSILLTLLLVRFQNYVIRKTASVAITADHLHYKGDLLMNAAVLVALGLSHYSAWPYFDPLFAMAISFSLLYGARRIWGESFDILMDKELSDDEREKILKLVGSHKNVTAVHDLRTRNTGHQIFIEFHLELDGRMSLKQAHDITEELEAILYDAFPKAEVLIHQEPAGLDDHRLDYKIKT
jgi:ferrous-iron efflux pump FieF